MRVKINWTEEMISALYDTSKGCKELAILLNLREGSVKNKRKSLGIKNNQSAVMSKPRPNRRKRKLVKCIAVNCNNTWETNQASKKKFCSPRCQMLTQNPSYEGMPRAIRNPDIKEYTRYARKVHHLSRKIYEKHKDIINPNNYPRTLCGVEGGWQLDHIIPIKECFEKGMSIEEASALDNLRMLPWKENLMRHFNGN